MPRPYQAGGLILARAMRLDPAMVSALQRDLRALGYLSSGIDGLFGSWTERAVRALQIDLLTNDGIGVDGRAPVAVASYNKGRVRGVNGIVDVGLASCMNAMLADPGFPKVPEAEDIA